ncbi:GGDEF domain-containing protein [Vibrio sp. PP-XX7]
MEILTLDAGRYAEKHETEFLFAEYSIGDLCVYFRSSVNCVYHSAIPQAYSPNSVDEIQSLDFSPEHGVPLSDQVFRCEGPLDELGELELELKHLMQRLAKEIINREQVEQQLIQLATQDKLTGAHNRHKWDEQLLCIWILPAEGVTSA